MKIKNKRFIPLSLLLVAVAFVILMMRVGYPRHRLIALAVYLLSWIPLVISYRANRQTLREKKARLKRVVHPYIPHIAVGVILLLVAYVAHVLTPVESSTLIEMGDEELREEVMADTGRCSALNLFLSELIDGAGKDMVLVDDEMPGVEQRRKIEKRWCGLVMDFFEFDMLKKKYINFYQIDYVTKPELHADAFFAGFFAFVSQYNACLRFVELVDNNDSLEKILNEGVVANSCNSYFELKQYLTHPDELVRLNAGSAYYELVKKDITLSPEVIDEFEGLRKEVYGRLAKGVELFVDNPLDALESRMFKAWFPVQKSVMVQMSCTRTAKRPYFIGPEDIAEWKGKIEPGDIMLERRNWHMTNVGIPGFWPHVALFVGSLKRIDVWFDGLDMLAGVKPSQFIKALYPRVYVALSQTDEDGFARNVIEALRPGVVIRSLEQSTNADYLGVIRPNLTKEQKFEALLAAFANFGKPYDYNLDFTTDNELVCSELVFKAYESVANLPFKPVMLSGRLVLPPNQMVASFDASLDTEKPPFSFVLFLDGDEKTGDVGVSDLESFRKSWERPKWDIMQK